MRPKWNRDFKINWKEFRNEFQLVSQFTWLMLLTIFVMLLGHFLFNSNQVQSPLTLEASNSDRVLQSEQQEVQASRGFHRGDWLRELLKSQKKESSLILKEGIPLDSSEFDSSKHNRKSQQEKH